MPVRNSARVKTDWGGIPACYTGIDPGSPAQKSNLLTTAPLSSLLWTYFVIEFFNILAHRD